jgi:8-oxo-dGTP diphosphatase
MILTVDIAVMTHCNNIVLIERRKEPFINKLALPGGHVEENDKTLADAAARELFEESGIKVLPKELKLLVLLDGLGRDPRPGRRVSVVYVTMLDEERLREMRAGSDAASIRLADICSLEPGQLAFDHMAIIDLLKK